MLKTLDEEIYPHHGGFTVTARDDNDVQTVGLHTCATSNKQYLKRVYVVIPNKVKDTIASTEVRDVHSGVCIQCTAVSSETVICVDCVLAWCVYVYMYIVYIIHIFNIIISNTYIFYETGVSFLLAF